RPGLRLERALDRDGGVERLRRTPEDREKLVGPRVDLVAARSADARPNGCPHIAEETGVVIAEPLQDSRRPLDVGQEESHRPARERPHDGPAGLAELTVEEAERHDAVLLRGAQQAL